MGQIFLYSLPELLAVKDDPNRWILPGMIPCPGRILIYGQGNAYKSTLLMDLCLAVSSNTGILQDSRDFQVMKRGPTVMVSAEGSLYTNRDRVMWQLRARNLDPMTVPFHYGQQSFAVDETEGRDLLIQFIKAVKPILLVLDPFISFYEGDENSAHEVRRFCKNIDVLIEDYGVSVAIIHHANKKDDIRGSGVLYAWADSVLEFKLQRAVQFPGLPQPNDLVTVECKKQRDGAVGRLFSAAPIFDKQSRMTTFGVYQDVEARSVGVAYLRQEIYKLLTLTGQALTKGQIRDQTGAAYERIEEALSGLIKIGLLQQITDTRATSSDGKRTRGVEAYITRGGISPVDAVATILQGLQVRRDLVSYVIDDRNSESTGLPRVQARSSLSPAN